jgi:NitT/TauT family transport system permease protein
MAVTTDFAIIEQPLPLWRRLWESATLRKTLILVLLAGAWQTYATWSNNPLMFPSFSETAEAFWDVFKHGVLVERTWTSLQLLLIGYSVGIFLAVLLAAFAASSRLGDDLLSMLTSMFAPLPSIALLPLAMLWFGLGAPSILFVLVHAVLWPVALNISTGFSAVSETLRMAGRNYGLTGVRYFTAILIPAALPSILTGLKIGWAFAWRTLIAAELVFGVASRSGGLGWFIFENKNRLETANVFAGLVTVILIGLLVDSVVFRLIERHTVRKWGMQR